MVILFSSFDGMLLLADDSSPSAGKGGCISPVAAEKGIDEVEVDKMDMVIGGASVALLVFLPEIFG
jgi:hypothetical protein